MVKHFLDVSQTLERRAKERYQVRHENMIGMQITIAVGRELLQLPQPEFQGAQNPVTDDLVVADAFPPPGLSRPSRHAGNKPQTPSGRNT